MEKLQAALEKARHSRSGAPQAKTPVSRNAQRTARSDLWWNIPAFEVPDHVLQHHRVVTRQAGPEAAPFDILRTKLLVQMRQNGWRRLAITSPMPKSGKTTVACNLALGLGRQRELRAILMDLDLRSPSVSSFFETPPPHDTADLLARRVTFEEQALRFGDNVLCSMSGRPDSDPTRLLLAEQTTAVLNEIDETYKPDLMIFDLPSVLVNDETRAFLKNVDCALIVARSNATRYGQFDTCEREVAEQTNVLGVVLNANLYSDKI
jgi:Mrp family chromosome partitioning ATPase